MTQLYLKDGCPWCEEVVAFMKEKNIPYEPVIVSSDPAKMQELLDLSGQTKAPTMNYEGTGEILADFGVEELVPFLLSHGVVL